MRLTIPMLVALASIAGSATMAKDEYAPLPQKIMDAKAIYIDNRTANAHAGDELFQGLTNWKRFQIVADKKDADLIFVLNRETHQETAAGTTVTNQVGTAQVTSGGPHTYTSGEAILTIQDAHDGSTLWTNTKPYSRKGATHDLVDDFKKRVEAQEKKSK
jgi:hypothetical protein